jgi:hypothetical protein
MGKERLLLDLLGKVPVQPDLIDRPELRFEPINMFFGIFDHIFKHVACGEITDFGAVGDGFAEQFHILSLISKICGE